MLRLTEIPITSSDFWQDENECTDEVLRHVFRSATDEEIPLLEERIACLREAGSVLYEVYLTSIIVCYIILMLICSHRNMNVVLPTVLQKPMVQQQLWSTSWLRTSLVSETRPSSAGRKSGSTSGPRSSLLIYGPASKVRVTESFMI